MLSQALRVAGTMKVQALWHAADWSDCATDALACLKVKPASLHQDFVQDVVAGGTISGPMVPLNSLLWTLRALSVPKAGHLLRGPYHGFPGPVGATSLEFRHKASHICLYTQHILHVQFLYVAVQLVYLYTCVDTSTCVCLCHIHVYMHVR